MNTFKSSPGEASGAAGTKRNPEQIEADIGRTRGQLDDTLDALQSKLSPSRRIHEAAGSARRMGERVARAAAAPVMPYITTMIQIDHTHVLALFRRLRPWTSAARKQAIIANACLALEIHAELEEEIFYPALRRALGNNELLQKSVPEHNEMRKLITTLRTMDVEDPGFDSTAQSLMQTVLHHVADEESMLLPQAERLLGDELGPLGLQMTRRRAELLRPHMKEVLVTTARSFPVLTAALGLGLLALSWTLVRPGGRS